MVYIRNPAGDRDVPLWRVGVNGIRNPMEVLDKPFVTQRIMATADAVSGRVSTRLIPEVDKQLKEYSCEKPKFVEDLARDVYIGILFFERFPRFSVEAEIQGAYTTIARSRTPRTVRGKELIYE